MACSFVAYVDEAGDEGFKKIGQGTPEWFVLSALVTRKHADITSVKVLDDVRIVLAKPASCHCISENLNIIKNWHLSIG